MEHNHGRNTHSSYIKPILGLFRREYYRDAHFCADKKPIRWRCNIKTMMLFRRFLRNILKVGLKISRSWLCYSPILAGCLKAHTKYAPWPCWPGCTITASLTRRSVFDVCLLVTDSMKVSVMSLWFIVEQRVFVFDVCEYWSRWKLYVNWVARVRLTRWDHQLLTSGAFWDSWALFCCISLFVFHTQWCTQLVSLNILIPLVHMQGLQQNVILGFQISDTLI